MAEGTARAYLAVCRPDHWFKNVFMLAGTLAAVLHPGETAEGFSLVARTAAAFVLCSLAASANYVINEILDARRDAVHPTKRHRPLASGRIQPGLCWVMWGGLCVVALAGSAWSFGSAVTFSIAALLLQGLVYNVPPVRTKEIAYLDVVTESVNNPIRLMIGWYAAAQTNLPPASLFFGYWVLGGFLMTAKRYAEFRFIGDSAVAAAYRSSFRRYSEESLLIAMICYASLAMFFYGVALVRYTQWDLFLSVPFVVAFLAWFFHLSFRPDSIVKEPERLFEAPAFAVYCAGLFGLIVLLAWVDLEPLWVWLNQLRIGIPLPGSPPPPP